MHTWAGVVDFLLSFKGNFQVTVFESRNRNLRFSHNRG